MKLTRRDHIALLLEPGAICVELGVAQGEFSERLLQYENVEKLYSVDKWSDHHNEAEYRRTQARLAPYGDRNKIIRASFANTVHCFPNEFFDLIYIDGYAHTGQESGKTLEDWWPKCKSGGIFSGDDYTTQYIKTKQVVDKFVKKYNLDLNIIHCSESGWESRYPTWWVKKP